MTASHRDSAPGNSFVRHVQRTAQANRGQALLVACVVIVLAVGAGSTIYNRLRPEPARRTEVADMGAPAITGAPVVHSQDTAQPLDEALGKRGAGLMLVSGGEVLLLKRSSPHNNRKWGLPGGNVETGDSDLRDTAKREATEEMGKLPPFNVEGEILTVRGKNDAKQYTVFLCSMSTKHKAAFKPQLNHEHFKWRWFPLEVAFKRPDLHPIVKRAFQSANRKAINEAFGLSL